MKTIKFRAWDKESKSWYENGRGLKLDWLFHLRPIVRENHLEWMQFTGLCDKNGKEIYEGDIMKFENPEKIKGSVEWVDGAFRVRRFVLLEAQWLNKTYLNKYNRTHIVCGNVYENPELLTKEKESVMVGKGMGAIPAHNKEDWERTFRDKLEEVLDAHFPKIEKKGKEKRLNKRSEALVLYAEAVTLALDVFEAGYGKCTEENEERGVLCVKCWGRGWIPVPPFIVCDCKIGEEYAEVRKEAVEGERKRIRDIIKKRRIGTTVFLDTQVDALLSLLSPEK